jgi:hypothetical protein
MAPQVEDGQLVGCRRDARGGAWSSAVATQEHGGPRRSLMAAPVAADLWRRPWRRLMAAPVAELVAAPMAELAGGGRGERQGARRGRRWAATETLSTGFGGNDDGGAVTPRGLGLSGPLAGRAWEFFGRAQPCRGAKLVFSFSPGPG